LAKGKDILRYVKFSRMFFAKRKNAYVTVRGKRGKSLNTELRNQTITLTVPLTNPNLN